METIPTKEEVALAISDAAAALNRAIRNGAFRGITTKVDIVNTQVFGTPVSDIHLVAVETWTRI